MELFYQTNHVNSDKLLLCLHGNSVDSNYFNPLIQQIKEWRVIAPDFLGHGSSPRLEASDYNVVNFVNCLVDVIEKESYKKLVIIGHSFGGNMACELLSKVKIDGICLMASAPLTYTLDEVPYLQLPDLVLTNNLEENERLINQYLANFSNAEETITYLKHTFAHTDSLFRTRLLEELQAGKFSDQLVRLQEHKETKLLVMFGENDNILNVPLVNRLCEEGIFPKARSLKTAGHFPLVDASDSCISFIEEFLEHILI
jgi:pimeloyl-ACP methyl ester carboxylesterase